ncbi:MAG TPA: MFS transporter, partial [Hyphomicrobiaceae bacterium]|nr:MFS transporter [Hyphomicrobiaceae bacterium]
MQNLGLCTAAFLGTITTMASSTIVNVAVPDLMRQFSASALSTQFVLTAFLATMTLAMPVAGWMTFRWGVRKVLSGALLMFAAASMTAALAGTLWWLIAARLVQGAAAGVIQPVSLAALYLAFPHHRRGYAVGLHALAIVIAPAVGPWLGGLAVEAYGWRAVFAGAVPIALVSTAACAMFVPPGKTGSSGAVAFDAGGIARLGLSFALIMTAGWEFARPEGSCAMAVLAFGGGLAAALIFWRHQRRAISPLLDLQLLKEPGLRASCAVGFLLGAGLYGSTLIVPLFGRFVQGFAPGDSGLVLLPAGVVLIAVSPVAAWLGDRLSLAALIGCGLLIFAISNLAFLAVDRQTSFAITATLLAVGRVGLGLASPLTNLAALRAVPDHHAYQAAGLISFSRQLGAILAVAGFSAIVGAPIPPDGRVSDSGTVTDGFHVAFALAAGLLLSGLLAVRRLDGQDVMPAPRM